MSQMITAKIIKKPMNINVIEYQDELYYSDIDLIQTIADIQSVDFIVSEIMETFFLGSDNQKGKEYYSRGFYEIRNKVNAVNTLLTTVLKSFEQLDIKPYC